MVQTSASSNPGKIFPVIFHLVLWSIWIGLPFMNSMDNPKMLAFSTWLLPISISRIPLFLLNSEWLIPRIFRKRGIAAYLLSLILLIVAFSILTQVYKITIIPKEVLGGRTDWFWAIVPVVFITAISTGYGFIIYLLRQEQSRQEEQQQRLTSELSFLRSQISPHFIFNILNSIVYLIRSQSDKAEFVTIQLSELMRYMLYTPQEQQVPIETELQYLENYIALQEIRFEEDVAILFRKTIEDSDISLEPMMLIPFVENAFKHGIGLIESPEIEILAEARKEAFHFFVKNKIGPETAQDKDESSGIGLKNVRRRLELLYPNSHQLNIREKDGWFLVDLKIEKTE